MEVLATQVYKIFYTFCCLIFIYCLIFFDEDFENYNRQYAFRKRNFYEVINDFPRLVASDLPIGLFDTKYNIELSAIEQFLVSNESILELIK